MIRWIMNRISALSDWIDDRQTIKAVPLEKLASQLNMTPDELKKMITERATKVEHVPSASMFILNDKLQLITSTSKDTVIERIRNDDGTWSDPEEIKLP